MQKKYVLIRNEPASSGGKQNKRGKEKGKIFIKI